MLRRSVVVQVCHAIALALLVGAAACSGGADDGAPASLGASPSTGREPALSPTAAPVATDTGSIRVQLSLPGGQRIGVVNWSITGPNGDPTYVQSASLNVQAPSIDFLASDIPAGSNYHLNLQAAATDFVSCFSTVNFNVVARVTTPVTAPLACYNVSIVPAMPRGGLILLLAAVAAIGSAAMRRAARATRRAPPPRTS